MTIPMLPVCIGRSRGQLILYWPCPRRNRVLAILNDILVRCNNLIVCVRGCCRVIADDGKHRQVFVLDSPAQGVYLPPLTWGVQ